MLRVDPASLAAAPADPARSVIERRLEMLTRLAEIGMQIAEAAGESARAAPDAAGGDRPLDPALMFARASRAVRLTIALQLRLLEALAALDRDDAKALSARKDRIQRRVERIIEDRCDDEGEAERLSTEAWERLTEAEDDEDLADAPIEQVVARICEHLGLSAEATAEAVAQASGESALEPASAPVCAPPPPLLTTGPPRPARLPVESG